MLLRGSVQPCCRQRSHAPPSCGNRARAAVCPPLRTDRHSGPGPQREVATYASAAAFEPDESRGAGPGEGYGTYSTLSTVLARLRALLFFTWSMILAVPFFCVMLAIQPFVLLFDKHRRRAQHGVNKLWARLSLLPFNAVEVEGLENMPDDDTPAVYVSNHESYMDIFALFHLGKDFKFVSKKQIFFIPIVGWSMFLTGHMGLDRLDAAGFRAFIADGKGLLKNGASLMVFPEGTRSVDGRLGEFKKGAFTIATMAKAVLVPITLEGTGKVMRSGCEGELRPGKIRIVVHPPIASKGSKTAKLAEDARSVIARRLPPWKTS